MQNTNVYEIPTRQAAVVNAADENGQDQTEYVEMQLKGYDPYQIVKPMATSTFIEGQDAPAVPQRNAVAASSPTRINSVPTSGGNPTKSTQCCPSRVDALVKVTAFLGLIFIAFVIAAVMLHLERQSDLKEVKDALARANNQIADITDRGKVWENLTRQYSELSAASERKSEKIQDLDAKIDEQRMNTSIAISKANERVGLIEIRSETWDNLMMKYLELSNASESKNERIKVLESKIDDYCPMRHGEKCFWIESSYTFITYQKGRAICAVRGGQLANIYSEENFHQILGYLRMYTSKYGYVNVWLGMEYSPQAKSTILSDGSPASFVKYRAGYPNERNCCWVALQAAVAWNATNQYMYTDGPATIKMGAVCEKYF